MARRLTTTSHAVLALLALRPWSAYDLTQQYRRSLRYAWPASLTKLYSEPKKLVDAGLAEAIEEPAGPQRTRTVYRITPEGRRALQRWLRTPAALPELNNEGMLRLAFADQGGTAELETMLARLRTQVEEWYREGIEQVQDYLAEDGGPFPQRMHLIALATDFHARFLELYLDWLDEVRSEAAGWPSTRDVGFTPATRARLEQILHRAEATLQRSTRQPCRS